MSHTPVDEAESVILFVTFSFLNWASVDLGHVLCVQLASCFILKASHPLSCLVLHFLLFISLHFWSPAPHWCAAPVFVSLSPSLCISVLVFPSALCLTHSHSSSCSSRFWIIDHSLEALVWLDWFLRFILAFIHPDREFLFNKLFELSYLLCASPAQTNDINSSGIYRPHRFWNIRNLQVCWMSSSPNQ